MMLPPGLAEMRGCPDSMCGNTNGKTSCPPVDDPHQIHQRRYHHCPDVPRDNYEHCSQRRNSSNCFRDAESYGRGSKVWRQRKKNFHWQILRCAQLFYFPRISKNLRASSHRLLMVFGDPQSPPQSGSSMEGENWNKSMDCQISISQGCWTSG